MLTGPVPGGHADLGPEAHDQARAGRGRPGLARRLPPPVPDPRAGRGAGVLREGAAARSTSPRRACPSRCACSSTWSETTGRVPPVVDARDVPDGPAPRPRRPSAPPWTCPSTRPCSRGRRGRGRPTASGRRTGTPPSSARPASSPTVRRPTRCPRAWQPLLARCQPLYEQPRPAPHPGGRPRRRRPDAADVRRAQPRPGREHRRATRPPRRGRRQPVRLGRPGRRRRLGGPAPVRRADLPARASTSTGCARPRWRWRSPRSRPTTRSPPRSPGPCRPTT